MYSKTIADIAQIAKQIISAASGMRNWYKNQENELKMKNVQNSGKSTLLGTGIGNSSINLQ